MMTEDNLEIEQSPADVSMLPEDETPFPGGNGKRKFPRWLRLVLLALMWIVVGIIVLPWLLYLPPVQTFVKDIAGKTVASRTGMKIEIGEFRLKFPLRISLADVNVMEAKGDTMVSAGEVVADISLLPLLGLDVRINRLQLVDGYYRMISPDSSMIMKVCARNLEIDGNSRFNIAESEIILDNAAISGGNLSLYMNVWKQRKQPQDTTSAPFLIKAGRLDLDDFTFAMSMLPTIDTLRFHTDALCLEKGVVDLRGNNITASLLKAESGSMKYIAPTPEYVASHPVPVDTLSQPSAPIRIMADSISLDSFKVLYATKGVVPALGFDAGYISLDNVGVGLRGFYNEASTVLLPLTRLCGKERCGLDIMSGHGTVRVDSTGLSLDKVRVMTPFSNLYVTAGIPFALMALKPEAPLDVNADVRLGIPDIEAFMPSLGEYTRALSRRVPLIMKFDAAGTLADVIVRRFDASIAGVMDIKAKGYARNALDYKNLIASLDIDGRVSDPTPLDGLAGNLGFGVPPLRLEGTASAAGQTYMADLRLTTSQGNVAADGRVSLTPETYVADVSVDNLNIAHFLPGYGLGCLTAAVKARGAGFNPTVPGASTDADIRLASIEYNGRVMRDITASAHLGDGLYSLSAYSPNREADLDLTAAGSIDKDFYEFDIAANIRRVDLMVLGLDSAENNGSGNITLRGTASPGRWLYDAVLDVRNLEWNFPGQNIRLPEGVTASVRAVADDVMARLESDMASLYFQSPTGLRRIVEGFTAAAAAAGRQIEDRTLLVDSISGMLPPFTLRADASGRGIVGELLRPSGMSLDTLWFALEKDSLIRGNGSVRALTSGTLRLDTINIGLSERGRMLDYAVHAGNRPGTLDEFAKVDIRGYAGYNRASLSLKQLNIKGETGYRIGMTGAIDDETVSLHFTPLKSTIAYMPWTFNADNRIVCNIKTMKIDADLTARSAESSIMMKTEPSVPGGPDIFHLNLTNIKVEDFLRMSVYAPPLTASVNSDIRVSYDGKTLNGIGSVDVRDFTYDDVKVGNFDLDISAGLDSNGDTRATAGMKVNGHSALSAFTVLRNDSTGLVPDSLSVRLTEFPLSIANPFIGADVARLAGSLNGEMRMGGTFLSPLFNGQISCDSVSVFLPMAGTSLRFDNEPLTVNESVIRFNAFDILAANENPLQINGTIDVRKFSDIGLDLQLDGKGFQLVGNDKRARSDLYGKLFLDVGATARGKVSMLDINGNVNVLGPTDISYTIPTAAAATVTQQTDEGVVKFVNFRDTTQMNKADTIVPSVNMRVNASLTITPGAQVTVNLSNNGTDKAQISPSGTLKYFQNYMGDMSLNGRLVLGQGFVRYNVPVVGEKMFEFDPASYVNWNGPLMNPALSIKATDAMKANIQQGGGNTRIVNFMISVAAGGTLSQPKVQFDLSASDDLTIQNELQSMTPDQRSQQAINLLLYGQYTGGGTKTVSGPITGNLYNFLASQVNSWAAKNIRGVDLSFGVDQYDQRQDGRQGTSMSYSYQLSKSLFNNRFKISVGGNYSTDASADENLTQNLVSDISFEYMIRQTSSYTMLVKLFRHSGYESILEGEITETGVGFVMKRKLGNLRRLFRFGNRRRRNQAADSTAVRTEALKPEQTETIGKEEKGE